MSRRAGLTAGTRATGPARLLPIALILAVVQRSLLDQLDWPVIGNADLPLLAVVAVTAAAPDRATVIGFVLGLSVDLLHTRLFGLHALAFASMGASVGIVPLVGPRNEGWRATGVAAQASLGLLVVALGAWLAGATPTPGRAELVAGAQTVALTVAAVFLAVRALDRLGFIAFPADLGPSPVTASSLTAVSARPTTEAIDR